MSLLAACHVLRDPAPAARIQQRMQRVLRHHTRAHQPALASNLVHPRASPLLCGPRVRVEVEVRLRLALLPDDEEADGLVPDGHLAVGGLDGDVEEAVRQLHACTCAMSGGHEGRCERDACERGARGPMRLKMLRAAQ
jgi:hypothetical protein